MIKGALEKLDLACPAAQRLRSEGRIEGKTVGELTTLRDTILETVQLRNSHKRLLESSGISW